ncbi:hypothetical protein D3C73_1182170 [compost metagenome]
MVATIALLSGSTTLKRTPYWVSPSMDAASSSSRGMFSKNDFMMSRLNTLMAFGSTTAQMVSRMPSELMRT